ncbi:hypothetical protein MEO93_17745 [Dolichospermum sp. ST_sed3]|nr:hypothetical protein [Dolichospermum sp. ST_sed9]MDD1433063.1 hypothetical protein [Dolichospermum sp. ST_sed6]MDD1435337.1 hypothetical protein [Dolichospermum sp. ST_sed10]MDD1442165.1 hypothetical protein [Dolichospermum sp. ST_sed3]MDD1447821.1 hypothetical protein [Dolichospermum sp. ST_sed8]MDD1456648.1 hypothetical protein [Dolichospermum sp. ST_sed7]MDD1462643.1 hypothetical protein [Dolichospermum sp. ST_sed2]MDD1473127.1 hypothetical protein [Dolichospermum sp. ST_sed4]
MFLEELRKSPEGHSLPVVLLTGSSNLTESIPSLYANVVGTILKPFDPILFSEQITEFIASRN